MKMSVKVGRLVSLLVLGLTACTQTSTPPVPTGGSIGGTLVLPGALGDDDGGAAAASQFAVIPMPDTPKEAEVVPGEIVVLFDKAVLTPQALTSPVPLREVRRLGPALGNMRLLKAEGLDGAQTKALARSLESQPGVKAAFPNWKLYAFAAPNDEFYPFQWHYPAMNLENAWNTETGQTRPVTVAVVDSGIVAHPDLVGNTLAGYDFVSDPANGGDGDARDNNPTDMGQQSGYHGSHVAGTMAAVSNNGTGVAGVSWGAKIVPVRTLGVTGSGNISDILDGILWAAGQSVAGVPNNPNPASVINMSLGANIGQECPAEIGATFRSLGNAGTIIVAAAGNDNVDAATFFPASCDGVVTVGATGPTGTRAPYSNYGTTLDIMAPGGDTSQTLTVGTETFPAGVLSTVADDQTQSYGYAFYQGTSMASPHVAGLVALMKARNPGLTFDQVLDQLKNASSPLSAAVCNRSAGTDCGAGSVDAAAALGGSAEPTPPAPPVTTALTTYVAALRCADAGCTAADEVNSRIDVLTPESNTAPYKLSDLLPGNYIAAAWQDLNANQEVDDGEPFGAYGGTSIVLLPITANEQYADATIYLEAFTTQSQAVTSMVPMLERGLKKLAH